jgi:hypothetical protein
MQLPVGDQPDRDLHHREVGRIASIPGVRAAMSSAMMPMPSPSRTSAQ